MFCFAAAAGSGVVLVERVSVESVFVEAAIVSMFFRSIQAMRASSGQNIARAIAKIVCAAEGKRKDWKSKPMPAGRNRRGMPCRSITCWRDDMRKLRKELRGIAF